MNFDLDPFTINDIIEAAEWTALARASIDGHDVRNLPLDLRTAAAELSRCLSISEKTLRKIASDGQSLTAQDALNLLEP